MKPLSIPYIDDSGQKTSFRLFLETNGYDINSKRVIRGRIECIDSNDDKPPILVGDISNIDCLTVRHCLEGIDNHGRITIKMDEVAYKDIAQILCTGDTRDMQLITAKLIAKEKLMIEIMPHDIFYIES